MENPIQVEPLKDGSGFILYVDVAGADVVKTDPNQSLPGRVFLGVVKQTTLTLNGRVWLLLENP